MILFYCFIYNKSHNMELNDLSDYVYISNYRKAHVYINKKNNNLMFVTIANTPIINKITGTKVILNNDRFKKINTKSEVNLDVTIVTNASKEETLEYTIHNNEIILESYEDYLNNKFPLIKDQENIWIDNIFNGKSEQNNILYKDSNIILLPDIKWNNKDMDSLYCLVIFSNKGLKSIRDLDRSHVQLIKDTYIKCISIIENIYGIKKNKLRAYFHYHPSYWQLHMHINLLENIIYEHIECVHIVNSVIENLNLDTNYYKKIKLPVISNIL